MTLLWTNDDDARALLPGKSRELHVVLFLRQDDVDRDALLARFAALPLPVAARAAAVDLDGAKEVARWFGIRQTPALGAVCDGALLALEDECAADACRHLIDFAATQLRALATERELAGRETSREVLR